MGEFRFPKLSSLNDIAVCRARAMFGALLMDQGAFWRNGETVDSSGVTYRTTPLAYAAEKKKSVPAAFKALKAGL